MINGSIVQASNELAVCDHRYMTPVVPGSGAGAAGKEKSAGTRVGTSAAPAFAG